MALSHADPKKASSSGGVAGPGAPGVGPRPAQAVEGPEPDLAGNAAQVEDAELGAHEGHDHERHQAGKAEPAAPTSFPTHAAAVAHHQSVKRTFGTVLDQAIAAGVDPARGVFDEANLLHNSAEWIKAGNTRVHIVTPTHDAKARGDGERLAFFDATKNWNELDGNYPEAAGVRNDPQLSRHFEGAHGAMNPGGTVLTMVNPVDPEAIRHTLIHEVQHDADQSWSGSVWEEKKKGRDQEMTASVNGYQSEFRAFWIMESDQFPPATAKASNQVPANYAQVLNISRSAFKNARQEAIFWEMAKYDSYKPYLFAWAEDEQFRAMVHNFAVPVSGNLVNSVRIQTLSERLTACDATSALDAPAVVALLETASSLDGLDRVFLADGVKSAPLWAQARRELSAEALAALRTAVA